MAHESRETEEDYYFQQHLRDREEQRWADDIASADCLQFADCVEFVPSRDVANEDHSRLWFVHDMLKDQTLARVKIDTRAFRPPPREAIPSASAFSYDWRVDIVSTTQCASYRVEHTVGGIRAKLI